MEPEQTSTAGRAEMTDRAKFRLCLSLMERWRHAQMVALYTPADLLEEIDKMLDENWPLIRNKQPPSSASTVARDE